MPCVILPLHLRGARDRLTTLVKLARFQLPMAAARQANQAHGTRQNLRTQTG